MNTSSDNAANAWPPAWWPSGAARTGLGEAMLSEQAKILYHRLPMLLAFHALLAATLVAGLWGATEPLALVIWASLMTALVACRGVLFMAYRHRVGAFVGRRWRVWYTLGSAVAGLVWGVGAAALLPTDSTVHQLFVLLVLVGVAAAAVSVLTAYLPAFYAYLPVSLIPVAALLLSGDQPSETALGGLAAGFAAALLLFGHTINRFVAESLRLRLENDELVAQLSEQRDEAERMNVSKSKFLAAASHDLRQPLHALALFASALDERIKYPEVRRIVDNINSAIRALEKLFGALLEVSRLDAGVLRPEIRTFALDDMLSALVNECTAEADAKGLDLECESTGAIVRSDPTLLERLVRNYLSNAIRYTERGRVRIACSKRGDQIRIDVIDTGIGVPPGQQQAIFEEFRQLGNSERDRTKGLGLGLAIVERTARLLDHPIEVSSAVGRGSRFSVTVPIGDPAAVTTSETVEVPDPRTDIVDLCVIVVDDEASVREGMSVLLAQWGCRVFTAASEDEAVAALHAATAQPDVIIADYRLRGRRTGVDAIARLRSEFGSDLPALIVTGDTVADRLREARAGGHPLVHKPAEPMALRAFLRSARRRQASR